MRIRFNPRIKLLSHPFARFGVVSLWVGVGLTVLAIALFVIIGVVAGNMEAAIPTLLAIGINAVVWLTIGIVMRRVVTGNATKLADLRQAGRMFEAEIVNLNMTGVNIGIYTPVVTADCVYTNELQQRVKVRSAMFMWENFIADKLKAVVHVDYEDPRRYAVEIMLREQTEQSVVDIDYT